MGHGQSGIRGLAGNGDRRRILARAGRNFVGATARCNSVVHPRACAEGDRARGRAKDTARWPALHRATAAERALGSRLADRGYGFETATELVRVVSSIAGIYQFTTSGRHSWDYGTSRCLCPEWRSGKSGRSELATSGCAALRSSSLFAVLVERAYQILRDFISVSAFDLMTLQHEYQLAILEQPDLW